jgi:hypothetical protein
LTDAKEIIAENARRHKEINKPYDPVTGEGCQGERVCLRIEDAPSPLLYLPKPMMNEYVCEILDRYKSIEKIFNINGEELTEDAYFDFWVSFCELRYRYDFEYFAATCLTIRHKLTGENVSFILNRGQRELLDRLEKMRIAGDPIRLNLLKSRQWGGSTLTQLYMGWIQFCHKENWNSVICAHIHDASKNIRAMLSRSVDKMIPIYGVKYHLKPFQGTQNIKEIPERGCLITVGTAVEPDSVRSQDVKMAHFSEVALFPNTENNNPENLEASIISSIPAEPYTMIVRESTANGIGDHFHTEWEKSKKGESVYDHLFVAWYTIDMNRKPFDGTYIQHNGRRKRGTIEDFILSMDKYEMNMFANHKGCTLENINWRRFERSQLPSETKMKQEYPLDDIEAFQDSGTPAFRSEDVEAMRKNCKPPIAIGTLSSLCSPNLAKLEPKRRKEILQEIKFVADEQALEDILSGDSKLKDLRERDKLKIWELADTDIKVSDRYVVIFDPQKGLSEKADWGVIAVIDRYWMMYGGKPEIVAEWRGRIDKDITIWVAAQIATYYCNALLVVESNTYESDSNKYDDSEFIFDTIADYYNNLYSRTPADKIIEGIPAVYGWHTNKSTKPMVIENYVAELREEGYIERCNEALDEARVYEQKKNKSFGAKEGKHDDRLMARMIGCYICRDLPMPKVIDNTRKNKIKKPVGVSSF